MNVEYRTRVESAINIVREQLWIIKDLKVMSNRDSAAYKEAIDIGIPPGLARSFKSELKVYKYIFRQREEVVDLH